MTLFLPSMEGGDASSIIVKTLSKKSGLNARQIHSAAQAGGAKVSYQGIHKALQKLLDEGVVEKLGKGYILSQDWINSLKNFTKASDHRATQLTISSEAAWPQSFKFTTLRELAQFLLDAMLELNRRFPEAVGIGHWKRAWPGTIFSKEDYDKLMELMKGKHFTLVNGNSFADKLFGEYYNKIEKQAGGRGDVGYGVSCAAECDIQVEGDCIFYIYFPTELKKKIDKIYAKIDARRQQDLALAELYDLVHNYKTSINVFVNKNEEVAEQIRRETLEQFK